MTWDKNVSVTVLPTAQAVDRAVFTVPLHLLATATFPERVRTYASSAEAAADPLLGSDGEAVVNAHFEQLLKSPTIKIGRSADSAVAQVVTFTIAGTPIENETYEIVINGIVSQHVAGATPTISSVHTALLAEVTANIASQDITPGGASPDITGTADNAGEMFTYSARVIDPPGGTATGTLTAVLTTASTGINSDLDAILAEDDAWYGLTLAINPTPATHLANMKACGAWCQANGERIFLGQSSDANVLTATAGNDLEELAALNRSRTAYVWHQDDTELESVGWMAYVFGTDPDVKATNWAYRPLSGISLKDPRLTTTEQNNIENQNGNVFARFGGVGVASMGINTIGGNIDVTSTGDWLTARLQEAYIQLLLEYSTRGDKIPLTDKGFVTITNKGQGVLDRGVTVGHLNPGTDDDDIDPPSISVTPRAQMSDEDVEKRRVTVTAEGTVAGAVERVRVTMTLYLV
jgi:hypothetical protein